MDYEKKDFRKLYEDLVKSEWFKKAYHDKSLGDCPFNIPELAESEDERIRAVILKLVLGMRDEIFTTADKLVTKPKVLAWLEKQKESLHISETCKENATSFTDEDENIRQALILLVSNDKKNGYTEFYKAQEITCDKVIAFLKKLKQLPTNEEMLRTLRVEYEKGVADTIAKYEQKEQKPKERFEEAREKYQVEWSEEDKDYYDTIVRKLEVIGDDSGLSDNQIKFLREHYPLNYSGWSEEDERMRCNILNALTPNLVYSCGKGTSTGTSMYKYDEEIRWLKSLRPSWKPSKEQMGVLYDSIEWEEERAEDVDFILKSLYNDLKKLM